MADAESAGEPWNPWRTLRGRPRTRLVWQRLEATGGFVEVWPDGTEVVVLDPRLGRCDRRAVLAHELVHLERGILPRGTPRAVVEREEHQVREETARRLVPLEALEAFVTTRAPVEPVTIATIAAEFDVPDSVASSAAAQLGATHRGGTAARIRKA